MTSHQIFRRKALEKLSTPERLDQLMNITTVPGWLALLTLGGLLVAATIWGIFAKIPTNASAEGTLFISDPGTGEAILYVSFQDGWRIQPGMAAKISPLTVAKEEYGRMLSSVTAVKEGPSTFEEMMRTLGNDTYVQSLVSAGKLIEVRVQLEADASTPSGFRWTSAHGPPTPVQSGLCTGDIVINEQRPIELVLSR